MLSEEGCLEASASTRDSVMGMSLAVFAVSESRSNSACVPKASFLGVGGGGTCTYSRLNQDVVHVRAYPKDFGIL